MFGQMVAELEGGRMPEKPLLRKRFAAALTKKLGVIRTPYSFWPADPKINPPAKHLLWAAVVLQDRENFQVVEAIIASELEERLRVKGQSVSMPELSARVQQLLQEYRQEFIELAPDETFKAKLRQKVAELFP